MYLFHEISWDFTRQKRCPQWNHIPDCTLKKKNFKKIGGKKQSKAKRRQFCKIVKLPPFCKAKQKGGKQSKMEAIFFLKQSKKKSIYFFCLHRGSNSGPFPYEGNATTNWAMEASADDTRGICWRHRALLQRLYTKKIFCFSFSISIHPEPWAPDNVCRCPRVWGDEIRWATSAWDRKVLARGRKLLVYGALSMSP